MKIPISIVIISHIIGALFIIYLLFLYFHNTSYLKQEKDFFIYYESNDKRYVEYYPNVYLSSNEEKNFTLKNFTFNNYELFCFCKNNTNYRIFDLNLCFMSKECKSNIQITPYFYNIDYLSNWNKKRLYDNKKIYNFYQGINNKTKKCDNNFDYKKCGFLMDLKIEFCIKENDICPFNDTDTNFYLTNLTSDIILLFEDQNLKIDNKYDISDFLPDIYILDNNNTKGITYEKFDSIKLYQFALDNNIPYLKEKLYNNTKNVDIDLGLLKLDMKKDIKLNQNFIYETKIITKFTFSNEFYLMYLTLNVFLLMTIFFIIFSGIGYASDQDQQLNLNILVSNLFLFFITVVVLIIMFIYLLYSTKEKLEKEYQLNEEYYKTIKSIKKIIFIIILIIMIIVINSLLLLISKYYDIKCCFFKNKKNFVEIVENSGTSNST